MPVDAYFATGLSRSILPKIKNGSLIIVGGDAAKTTVKVDQHFNRFQKKMLRWCFGFKVEDYSEE